MAKRQPSGRRNSPAVIEKTDLDISMLIIEDEYTDDKEETSESVQDDYTGRGADTTVLAYGTTFFGDIKTEGHIEIAGTLAGSADAKKNIIISGKIEGNASADCISLQNCAVRGDINAKGELTVLEGSVVMGNIAAETIALCGKVCGNIKAAKALVLQTGAYVIGDIEAETLTVQEGCSLFGKVSAISKEGKALTREAFDALIDERK